MQQTYTFESVIQNGIIPIPEEYRNIAIGEVKITIQKEEINLPKNKKTFDAIKLDTVNFTFNREESNARY
jgi:hypothetical protein